ncbi:MAG: DUF362 domain-containing protein [Pseudomonadota bacterium]
MKKPIVAIKRYEHSPGSARELIDLCEGFHDLKGHHHVLIKPNLVGLDRQYPISLYGIFTTTRLVHDVVFLLKEYGVEKIALGEGSVHGKGYGVDTHEIYKILGYPLLKERYGVTLLDLLGEPFKEEDFDHFRLQISRPALESDFLINMPVLKTHNQSVLSLGLKNLKGCLSLKSRKFCHRPDQSLEHYLSLFIEKVRPALTILDGIYGLENGPYYAGKAVRMDALVASKDPLAADAAGAFLTGFDPFHIPHIREYAERHHRSLDQNQFHFLGTPIHELRRPLKWDHPWREDDTGPKIWDRAGIKGVSIPKYDKTLCTGCSAFYSPILVMISTAYRGQPFPEVEILSGKSMEPSGHANKSILLGNCMIKANRRHPNIREAVFAKGCPPLLGSIRKALNHCGINANLSVYEKYRHSLVERYKGKEGFDEGFFYLR